jgi:hypothetical protein
MADEHARMGLSRDGVLRMLGICARAMKRRPELLAAAWRCGVRDVANLAAADLSSHGISVVADRRAAAGPARPPVATPLDGDEVANLAELMAAVLGPSMLGEPESLACAAWMAQNVVAVIARLLAPELADEARALALGDIADRADAIRRVVFGQLADEASRRELADATEWMLTGPIDLEDGVVVEDVTATVVMPDGRTRVKVTMSVTEAGSPLTGGLIDWETSPAVAIEPVGGREQLEVANVFRLLGEVIGSKLAPGVGQAQ